MSLTNTLEELIGDHLLRNATWAKPGTIYIGLLTAGPGEQGGGTEVSGGNYARVAAGPGDSDWSGPVSANKTFSNAVDKTFPTPNADWGTVTHFAIYDAATGGMMLAYAALTAGRTIHGTDPAPLFAAGDLKLVFSGDASDYLIGLIGDHLLRTATWAKPAGIFIALVTNTPAEVSGGGYARQSAGPSDSVWNAPAGGDGLYANAVAIVWSTPSADWGNVTKTGFYDAASAGNSLAEIALTTPRNIQSGALPPNFAAGDLSLAIN